jgi:hypothetical protein
MLFLRPLFTLAADEPITIQVSTCGAPVIINSDGYINTRRIDWLGLLAGLGGSVVNVSHSAGSVVAGRSIKGTIRTNATGTGSGRTVVQYPRGSRLKLLGNTAVELTPAAIDAGITLE